MFFQIYSDLLRKSFTQAIKSNTFHHKSHYEVLNLPQNCTLKQIKESFIELSKKHHPDVDKSHLAHAKFLRIREAYNILSKPDLRQNYDLGLSNSINRDYVHTRSPRHFYQDIYKDPWKDPSFFANRNKTRDRFYEEQAYYGVKGVPRLPNGIVAFLLLLFASAGVGLQFLAIRKSFTFQRDKLLAKSAQAQSELNEVKETAERNGNELQIKLFEKKMLDYTDQR